MKMKKKGKKEKEKKMLLFIRCEEGSNGFLSSISSY